MRPLPPRTPLAKAARVGAPGSYALVHRGCMTDQEQVAWHLWVEDRTAAWLTPGDPEALNLLPHKRAGLEQAQAHHRARRRAIEEAPDPLVAMWSVAEGSE